MPARDYEVHLEIFEGPLDLLLFLIRKDDLDIRDIPISEITREYLSYIELMKDLNLETAGEFLVMASTLMQIKARMLLPSAGASAEEEQGPDPRAELIEKLLEYQKYKQAARFLQARSEEFKDVFYRGSPRFAEDEKSLSIGIFDLLSALKEVLDAAEDRGMVVTGEQFPVEEMVRKILELLETHPYLSFRRLLEGEERRAAILSCFLALLELIKLQKIFARQDEQFGEIRIYRKEAPAEPAVPIRPGADAGSAEV